MDTDTKTQKPSLSVEQAWELYQQAERECEETIKQALRDKSAALLFVTDCAGDKTFYVDGQLKQVRERKNKKVDGEKLAFVCDLDKEPSEWLAEARAKKVAEAQARQETTAEDILSADPTASEEPEVVQSRPPQETAEASSESTEEESASEEQATAAASAESTEEEAGESSGNDSAALFDDSATVLV